MEIQISKETLLQLKKASQKLGSDETEIINKALILYLRYAHSSISLNEEIKSWEDAGIEDLNNFDEKL
ncbi:hypothetical protein CMI39_03360 [Candidatus Pacearchaeota archaeon]|jgi:hypothetical protein|nr:hypothetical protein [Candidatus Pacearchaeota archaeon]|tara:strand:+ start:3845 stop:4048 length:204 start_codon:yes stop_codon:yes gene_type:complete